MSKPTTFPAPKVDTWDPYELAHTYRGRAVKGLIDTLLEILKENDEDLVYDQIGTDLLKGLLVLYPQKNKE